MRRRSNARAWAKQLALLVGSFAVTLALLMTVWMVASGNRAPASTPTPAPEVTEAPVPTAEPTAEPTAAPPSSPPVPVTPSPAPPSPSPSPTPTAVPLRTPLPSAPVQASTIPADTLTFVVDGADYVASDVPSGATLERFGTSAVLTTTRDSGDALWVTWRLDPALLPVGRTIHSVDVRICGAGQGHFWEVYGPDGGDPFEYEVVPPNDGDCWLFSDAPGHDLTVLGGTMLESRMTITRVEYEVTFGL